MSAPGVAVTWLFVPGDRPDRFAKAAAAGADQVIIDLQDAVAAPAKAAARAAAVEWWAGGGSASVRINPPGSADGAADLATLAGLGSGPADAGSAPDSVVVPLTESAEDPAAVAAALPGVPIVALVESARGVTRLREIAGHRATSRLAFGNLDTAADLGCPPDSPLLDQLRGLLVVESRAAGLPAPIDGVTPDFADQASTARDAAAARALGFGGKLCIHPRQLEPAAAAFAPTAAEVDWARRVLAVTGLGSGVVVVDGVMVDAPVVRRAQAIVARAAAAELG